ncbi:Protein of unknown function [Gryllus bimaculatus]|nr:Protein of unknown function [Gryllus bimaculatus]
MKQNPRNSPRNEANRVPGRPLRF